MDSELRAVFEAARAEAPKGFKRSTAENQRLLVQSGVNGVGDLIRAMSDADPAVALSAIEFVGHIRDRDLARAAAAELLSIVRNASLPDAVRAAAMWKLGLAEPELAAPLVPVALHMAVASSHTRGGSDLRRAAIAALGWLRDRRAVDCLVRLVQDLSEPDEIRAEAAEAINNADRYADLPDRPEAVSALQACAQGASPALRRVVRRVLKLVEAQGGTDSGAVPPSGWA